MAWNGKESALAIFGKFGGSSSNEPNPADYSPEKAQKFFDHARTAADTENYEYAIQHFCNGLKQDPRQKAGFDGLWGAVSKFKDSAAGKKGLSKETWRAIAGTGDVSRFVSAVLEWMITFGDVNLALKAAVEGNLTMRIHTPLIHLTKAQIIERGLALGVDYGLTTSCYDPAPDGAACGRCDACLLRLKGFAERGLRDPRRYQ